MKKLALNVEALAVESFVTTLDRRGARGTVNGHSYGPQLPSAACPPDDGTQYRITQDAACGPYTGGGGGGGGGSDITCALSICIPLTAPDNN